MMDITTYDGLVKETQVEQLEDGLIIYVPSNWVVDGEKRLSYTTITRLIECCREYHWKKDILSIDHDIDSICGGFEAKFIRIIVSNSKVFIRYKVIYVFEKKYILDFEVLDNYQTICAYIRMEIYFIDSMGETQAIPKRLAQVLCRRLKDV